ncbi:MAG: peptidylprolyl isomerase [Gammaproteobacteria bacterium]|nr:MAG: peptidylprolyl isomerase [Gammaproteobacteria bacterium]
MPKVKETVQANRAIFITYTIVEKNGDLLEQNDIPIGYIHGCDSGLLPVVEKELEGKKVGDKVEVLVSPEDGFGAYDDDLTHTDDIENVPEQVRYVGAEVQMQNDKGDTRTFKVSHMDDEQLTIDGNHPYAGKTLIYTVRIESMRPATPVEVEKGRPEDVGPITIN